MKVLAVHPSGLMYTRVFLRLEPLGLEMVAAVLREAGHEVRLLDLQVESHRDLERLIRKWRPDAVCFSGNYLANIPEIIDLSKAIKAQWPGCFVFVGGHSASFTAADLLRHADGAIDCILKGEGRRTPRCRGGPRRSAVDSGRRDLQRRRAATRLRGSARSGSPRARSAATSAQILHWRAGSVCVD